jgi:hypothetical protein
VTHCKLSFKPFVFTSPACVAGYFIHPFFSKKNNHFCLLTDLCQTQHSIERNVVTNKLVCILCVCLFSVSPTNNTMNELLRSSCANNKRSKNKLHELTTHTANVPIQLSSIFPYPFPVQIPPPLPPQNHKLQLLQLQSEQV